MKRQRFLRRLRKMIKKYGSENVVYFDESGFVSHKGRLSGWAPAGQKLYAEKNGWHRLFLQGLVQEKR